MNRQEHSDTYARENESRIAHREFLLQGVEKLTLFHDTFMKVVLNDLEVCQYVIRILMDDPTIEIVDVRNQYRLARLTSKDSILDILAEDSRGRFYNLEIQRDTTRTIPAAPACTAPWWTGNTCKKAKTTMRCRKCT